MGEVESKEDWIAEPVLWISNWVHLGCLQAKEGCTQCTLIAIDPCKFIGVITMNPQACRVTKEYARNFTAWINSLSHENLSDIWQGDDENVKKRVYTFLGARPSKYKKTSLERRNTETE